MKKRITDQNHTLPIGVTPEQLVKKLHSFEGRLAEFITRWSGSMYFVYAHVIIFTFFFIFKPFEESIFNIFLSLEAVFLATFIMVAQNRQALVDTVRELEEDADELEEEKEQEELEEDVQDIQKDLDDIKNAMAFIQQKISGLEKSPATSDKSKS
jgi:uncharacterized membrane protein